MEKDSLNTIKDTLSLVAEKEEILNAVNPENVKDGIVEKVTAFSDMIENTIARLLEAIPSIIAAVLALVLGLFVIRTILKIVSKRFEKRNVDVSLRGFLLSIIKFVLYALLLLSIAGNLGFQTTAILGALSGLVLAVGLALQGSLSNFAGGVLILLFRPFDVGDYIENSAGTDGTVDKIDLLYTTLTTAQGIKVYSPNGALANSVIKNFSKITNRRFEYVVGISYDSNIKTAQTVILEILNNDSRIVKDPAPDVFVSALADSSVNLTIRAWAAKDNYWDARNALQQDIKIALDQAGISIPFPQQEMRIISDKPEIK
ncbi:mechanosensitive ion channel [Flavobacterium dauae]|uniref:mechanosensitive ion channel family protein n=1 Tax=Flavobacterium dauae TaxID=1563479 RepID=UPI00101B23DA|nr:mechanosensitive ion channel domain-containing protein [Flavobacterium dauae]WLD23195.1 mechanosensitive ion channel [Flavobacterium dauae]